jgi:hypothetical protein
LPCTRPMVRTYLLYHAEWHFAESSREASPSSMSFLALVLRHPPLQPRGSRLRNAPRSSRRLRALQMAPEMLIVPSVLPIRHVQIHPAHADRVLVALLVGEDGTWVVVGMARLRLVRHALLPGRPSHPQYTTIGGICLCVSTIFVVKNPSDAWSGSSPQLIKEGGDCVGAKGGRLAMTMRQPQCALVHAWRRRAFHVQWAL